MSAAGSDTGGGLGRFETVLAAVEKAASEILEEAEREAQRRIEEADGEVQRIVEERARELSGLSAELLERAERIRAQADVLLTMLDEEIAALSRPRAASPQAPEPARPRAEAPDAPSTAGETPAPAPAPVQPAEAAAPADEPKPAEGDTLAGLRERLGALSQPPQNVPLGSTGGEEGRPRFGRDRARNGPAAPASEAAILLATQMAVAGATPAQIEARLRDDFGIEDPGPILERIAS
ncbi:MAG TPA: hypothetical protein VIL04_07790 [Solirubrobacterales bacterium]|jgi:vacuolar-type H+-ATPase subunit H